VLPWRRGRPDRGPVTNMPRDADDGQRWYRSVPQLLSESGMGLVVGRPEKPEFVNDAFCALTGYSVDEILALPSFLDIVVPEARDRILERAQRRIAGGKEPSRYETEVLHRDGRRIPVEVNAHVSVIDGRSQIVATLRDLTDDKRVAADLAARARQQEAVAELGRLALVDRDLASLMSAAVNGVAHILGVQYVEILELLPDGEEFVLRAGVGWDDGVVGQIGRAHV
jgi:PAS domain S-box-containing protein